MEKGLAKTTTRMPALMANAYETLEGMKLIAEMYIQSRTIPDHFYEKGPDNKPDYTKGKVSSVSAVLIRGYELEIKASTALQSVIPINGLLSLKVDLMKSMIFGSGTMEKGGWIEKYEGTIEDGNYKVSITGKRRDNGMVMTRSFSVADAKRAGLWITQEMLQKQDGWRYKQSAWYKYPNRMVLTRAAGFLCRDLWGDVIDNSVSYEEARDYPEDTTIVVEKDGTEIIIPDKQFTEDRSKRITGNAAALIDEFNDTPTQEEKPVEEQKVQELPDAFHWTKEELSKAKAKDLEDACNQVGITKDAVQIIPGKNTNKKMRIIILAHMAGKLPSIMDNYRSGEPYTKPETVKQETSPVESSMPHGGPVLGQEPKVAHQETPPAEKDPDDFMEPAEGADQGGEIEQNLEFEGKGEYVQSSTKEPATNESIQPDNEASIPVDTNKHGIEIPELSENGDRPFEQLSQLFMGMQEAGLNNQQFDEANAKMLKGKYKNMEEFCKIAPASEINILLNSIG